MRKFFYLLPIVAMIFCLASCSSDDDEVIRHTLTVNVVLPEELTKAGEVSGLAVTAFNNTTSQTSVAQIQGTTATLELIPGTYNLTVSGEMKDFNVNGVKAGVRVFDNTSVSIDLIATVPSSLVFKEVYFSGVPDWYFQDAFYEIYNNTDQVQYLDGVILAVVDNGLAPGTFNKDQPSVWMANGVYTDGKYPLTSHVECFPGNGTDYPLQPRTSVLIAANPIDHTARTLGDTDSPSPVDLSKADWQFYTENATMADSKVKDIPAMDVPWLSWGREMMPATEGQALILARLKDISPIDYAALPEAVGTIPGGTTKCFLIPSDCILDAIDIVPASVDCHFKHIEAKDDAGMTWIEGKNGGNGEYSGKSLRRKVAGFTLDGKAILKDTNNSSNDFTTGGVTPTPGIIPTVVD